MGLGFCSSWWEYGSFVPHFCPSDACAGNSSGSSAGIAYKWVDENGVTHYGDRLPPPGLYDRGVQEIERPLLSLCLSATRGNQIRAAHLLGLNRNTLRKKIRDLGLEVVRGLKTG